jgi:hypothetical protein
MVNVLDLAEHFTTGIFKLYFKFAHLNFAWILCGLEILPVLNAREISGVGEYLIFVIPVNFGYLKKSRIKGLRVVGIWKFWETKNMPGSSIWGKNNNQILRTTGSEHFKNFKEPLGFMKEPTKTQLILFIYN